MRRVIVLAAVATLASPLGVVRAGDMVPAEPVTVKPGQHSILDGKVFRGEFGVVGKESRGTDTWAFESGTFVSESCAECGFPRSPYKVRLEDGGVAFETETRCPRTDAQIVWRGTVKDGRIEGVWTWTKERWYWTIEKQFWFKGTLQQASASAPATPY